MNISLVEFHRKYLVPLSPDYLNDTDFVTKLSGLFKDSSDLISLTALFFEKATDFFLRSGDSFKACLMLMRSAILEPNREKILRIIEFLALMGKYSQAKTFAENHPEVPDFEILTERIRTWEKIESAIENHFKKGEITQALALATTTNITVGNARIKNCLGVISHQERRFSTALNHFEQAFRINPLDEDIKQNFADLVKMEKKLIEQEHLLSEINKLSSLKIEFECLLEFLLYRKSPNINIFFEVFQNATELKTNSPLFLFCGLCFRTFVLVCTPSGINSFDVARMILISRTSFAPCWLELFPDERLQERLLEAQKAYLSHNALQRLVDINLMALFGTIFNVDRENLKLVFIERLCNIENLALQLALPQNVKAIDVITPTVKSFFTDIDDFLSTFSKWLDSLSYNRENPQADLFLKIHLAWIIQFWNIYGSEKNFLVLYEPLKRMLYRFMKIGWHEAAFCMHFPISHLYLNLTQTQEEWKKFNDEIELPFSKYIQEKLIPGLGIKPNEEAFCPDKRPLKVGFVYDRIVMNSPFKVLYSLLESLIENGEKEVFEYAVYDLEYVDKSPSQALAVEMITDLGIKYVSNHDLISDKNYGYAYNRLQKCLLLREKIIADEIDILVMCNGREQFNFLFSTRTAPKQIFWNHGMFSYNIPNIDGRIIHSWNSFAGDKRGGFDFSTLVLINSKKFYSPPVNQEEVNTIRSQYPKDALILGFIGRLIKIESEEYLNAVFEILKRKKECIFLACGGGGPEKIKQKVIENGLQDRFLFPGYVDPHVYAHVIDLFLDSFPFGSGEALSEYAAKGKVYINFVKIEEKLYLETFEKNYFAQGPAYQQVLQKNGLSLSDLLKTSAFSSSDYISKTTFLIENPEFRARRAMYNKEIFETNFDRARRSTYPSFFEAVCKKS
ncbi:MAG: hypothetical protein HQM08_20980 [Candidatus Riflebacteria bacterium]|nr:hypothetical protein [Candidatus Riflebacteria bacterium]